jgi:type IV secretory pathway VirB6-like protein
MSYDRSIQEEEEEEEDDIYNDTPFEEISSECKKLVLQVKRVLYTSIIFGPDLKSKEAQSNELLLIYLKKMMKLYEICMTVENETITEDILQKKLMTFPMETRDIISQLVNWITIFFSKNQYVDTIPYIDYLDIHFRKHPLLQK